MKNRKGKVWIIIGLLLIAAALFLIGYNLREGMQAEESSVEAAEQLSEQLGISEEPQPSADPLPGEQSEELPDYILYPDMEMPVKTIDGQDYIGLLSIPALEIELPIISEWSYPRLKIAPCRYSGSAYTGDLVIAGHNYRAHFRKLKNLQEGDLIIFTDVDGNVFRYEVAYLEVLPPRASEEMRSGSWDLALFTCTIGGKSRVTVRCDQIDDRGVPRAVFASAGSVGESWN